jgi:hypothetical protein
MRYLSRPVAVAVWSAIVIIACCCSDEQSRAAGDGSSPIATAVRSSGGQLADDTLEWMKKFAGIDLDDTATYRFRDLSGSTSINLKVQKIDPTDPKGYKSRGSFVPRNSSANPDVEAAAFNLAVILGFDRNYRFAAKYSLGPTAKSAFKALLLATNFSSASRKANKNRILLAMESAPRLPGVLKAKKDDSTVALDAMAAPKAGPNGGPSSSHPIMRFLQASNPQPVAGKELTLRSGYTGDELELVREYSVIMLIDALTQQWDRYSGGNITIRKDADGKAHFYATDNGGADFSSQWSSRNVDWFSRYDRTAIAKLTELRDFLDQPEKGLLGYKDAENFVVDLGLDIEMKPAAYLALLRRNIAKVLDRVRQNEQQFGDGVFLPQP